MPRPKPLTERFVQHAVAERLNADYYGRRPVYASTEVYTKLKRADVLLAFMRAPGRPYVVVVEAKSRTTIHQLKLKQDRGKARWLGRLLAGVLVVGLVTALGYQWYFNAVNTLLLLGVFVVGSAAVTALVHRLELGLLSSISAIEQLGQYPANESWIAVGEDTFVRPPQYRKLVDQCEKNGVGLIVVDRRGRLGLRVKPRPRHVFNNYLDRYGKEAAIRKRIDRNPRYGPTPPERAKTRRQLLNATVLLALAGLLITIGYEENYGPVVADPFVESLFDAAGPDRSTATTDPAAGPDLPNDPFATDPFPADDCGALVVTTRSFIVADAILPPAQAQRRVNELSALGLRGHGSVPADCLHSWPAAGRAVVWTGVVYPDRAAARAAARDFRALLAQRGQRSSFGKPVKIYPR